MTFPNLKRDNLGATNWIGEKNLGGPTNANAAQKKPRNEAGLQKGGSYRCFRVASDPSATKDVKKHEAGDLGT
jgi:hypothetical protein